MVIAILTNRLTKWSFTNEVKAQFRYKQIRQVFSFNREVIEHLKIGILVLTSKEKVVSINQRAVELLNLNDPQEIINLSELSSLLLYRFRSWQVTGGESNNYTYRYNEGADEVFVSFLGFGRLEQKKSPW